MVVFKDTATEKQINDVVDEVHRSGTLSSLLRFTIEVTKSTPQVAGKSAIDTNLS